LLAGAGCKSSEFDQSRLIGMEFEAKRFHSLPQFSDASFGIVPVLEAHHEVIGMPHDDDITPCARASPMVHPQVQHIVQKYVG
jgi:hypothetical protein